jgi:hypothetical protein
MNQENGNWSDSLCQSTIGYHICEKPAPVSSITPTTTDSMFLITDKSLLKLYAMKI